MGLHPVIPQNWSSAFSVWIEDVQIQFTPTAPRTYRGGLLRQVRSISRISAALVVLFFSLHCSRPVASPGQARRPSGEAQPEETIPAYTETGEASWYGSPGDGFEGRTTASGEIMTSSNLTCAHKTLPLGSYLEVENLDNGRKAILKINDRGPYIRGRIVDVSRQAASDLGFLERGKTRVKIRAVEKDGRPSRRMSPVDLSNPLTIQVAALSDPANIERLAKELEAIGPVTFQNVATSQGTVIKRIRVGSYLTMEEARHAAELITQRFGARGVDPFITRQY